MMLWQFVDQRHRKMRWAHWSFDLKGRFCQPRPSGLGTNRKHDPGPEGAVRFA